MTIAELQSSLDVPLNPTTNEEAGLPLQTEYLRSSTLKVDQDYQRMVSKTALGNYGTLKRDRLVSTLVSRRPESCGDFAGDFIIDGQHKAIMHYCSETETDDSITWLPCQVKIWPLDMSIVEIRKGEARLFNDNNLMRKKPTKVDTYRSGAFFGDPEALLVEKYLINLNLVIDNFGSTDEKAVELYTPNPFFYTILHDLQDNGFGINQAQAGLAL